MQLGDLLRTGRAVEPINDDGHGEEFFADFVESLFPLSYRAAQAAGEHLGVPQWDESASVLDLGAGSGVWGIALAEQNPRLRILAVDWPKVLEVTRRIATRHGVGDRLQTSAGDLLEADFGKGHRLAVLGHVLHSEGCERSRKLLPRIFEALAPGGILMISEFVPNETRTGPPNALIFAVNMAIHTEQGDTFTVGEMTTWLLEAGFEPPDVLEAPAPSPLLLARKPA
jgi:2-polyprenyl-3-methyl-5-hydroxy-6-metoxy-1,4-benzoquinol methylase